MVGPNKIENVAFDLIKEDGTVGDAKNVDITPTLGAKEIVDSTFGTDVAVNATPDLSSYTTTLTDSDTDGTIDSIVDLTIGKGTIDIGTDS